MSNFRELQVWKSAHELVIQIYKAIKSFPVEEKYGLADQLRRAASSVPINICEGTGRNSKKDFINFLYIARGSLHETEYLLLLANDLKYIGINDYNLILSKCNETGKMLNGLINRITDS